MEENSVNISTLHGNFKDLALSASGCIGTLKENYDC